MKQINDSKLYLLLSAVAFTLFILLITIFLYSKILIEMPAEKLINSELDINRNYREAYFLLRDPQIFALYENFDIEGRRVLISLRILDNKMITKGLLNKDDKRYLVSLLERRSKGSHLSLYTSVFFSMLFIIFLILYKTEKSGIKHE